MKKFRVVSRARFTIFLVIICLLVFGMFSMAAGSSTASSESKVQYHAVEIHSGDSLWTIAEDYNKENLDIRQVVADICDVNDIRADEIQPGQMILVPAY